MKNIKRMLAFVLAAFMLLSCAFAEDTATPAEPAFEATETEPVDTNPVIARLREHEVRYQDVTNYAQQMYSEGLISSATDYASALDYLLIYNALPKVMVGELGIENLLSAEKLEELYAQAEEIYKNEIDSYIAYYYGSELSDEDYQVLYDMVVGAYTEAGYSLEQYREDFVTGEAFAEHFNTFKFEIPEEKLLEVFDKFVEDDKGMFDGNAMLYEYAVNYYNYVPYYMPEGYRGITHILINADEEALSAYAAVKDGTDAEAIENARAAVIESCKELLDEIYGKIEAGEDFESLIAQYNTDPGMSGDNLKNGYSVHKDTIVFMQEFTDGSFSEKMQKVGDVSDPVVTSYGVHILYYLRDIPGGAIEYTDEVRASIEEYCIAIEQDALLRQWLTDYGVEYTTAYADMMG